MSDAETQVLPIGRLVLGRYRIERLLGTGAHGRVYEALQAGVERRVAVKILRTGPARVGPARDRFVREATVLAKIQHPNVVQLYDFDLDEGLGLPVLVFEWIDGRTLLERLRAEGPLPAQQAAEWLAQVASALEAAHAEGVVHRDLKPANLMLRRHGPAEEIKVIDFGVARLLEPESGAIPLTAHGGFVGTPHFASPEQLLGDPVGPTSDLYALGCLLHACLTGTAVFLGERPEDVVRMHRSEAPPPLPERDSAGQPLAPEWRLLHQRLLAKKPSERPATATEVRQALLLLSGFEEAPGPTQIIARAPTEAPTRLTPSPPAPRRRSRPRGLPILLGGAAVLAGLIGLGYGLPRPGPALSEAPQGADSAPSGAPAATPVEAQARPRAIAAPRWLRSDPTGAEVWQGARFVGQTPLDLAGWDGTGRLTLRLAGYTDTSTDPGTVGELQIRLKPSPKPTPAGPSRDPPRPAYPVW